jgi:hypothetical protein
MANRTLQAGVPMTFTGVSYPGSTTITLFVVGEGDPFDALAAFMAGLGS